PRSAQSSVTDRKAAPCRPGPAGRCHSPHLPLAARTTRHNRATRRARRPLVLRSADATPDPNRLPPEVSSFPSKPRRGGPFRSKQKSSATALCLRARPELPPASRARHGAGPPRESQERRCRRKQALVVREKLSALSLQRRRPALAAGETYAIRTAFVANVVVADCAGFRCMRERSSSPSTCNPSKSCACVGPSFPSAESG